MIDLPKFTGPALRNELKILTVSEKSVKMWLANNWNSNTPIQTIW